MVIVPSLKAVRLVAPSGSSRGLEVLDAETGARIPGVLCVELSATAGSVLSARIEVLVSEIHLADVSATIVPKAYCPHCENLVEIKVVKQGEIELRSGALASNAADVHMASESSNAARSRFASLDSSGPNETARGATPSGVADPAILSGSRKGLPSGAL